MKSVFYFRLIIWSFDDVFLVILYLRKYFYEIYLRKLFDCVFKNINIKHAFFKK